MRISAENLRLCRLIGQSWIRSIWLIRVSRPSAYLPALIPSEATKDEPAPPLGPAQWKQVRKVVRGITRLSPLFAVRHRCLMESITAHWTLARLSINSRLHLGVKKNTEEASAHAWLEVEGKKIIGGATGEYRELFRTH